MRGGATLILLILLAPASVSSAASETLFDGRVVECETTQSYEVLGGTQVTRYTFLGDGVVEIDVVRGALDCEGGVRVGAYRLGEPRAYTVRCAREGVYGDLGVVPIVFNADGESSVSVEGERIYGADAKEIDLSVGDRRFEATASYEYEIRCDGDVCSGGYSAVADGGVEWSDDLRCVVRSLAGS